MFDNTIVDTKDTFFLGKLYQVVEYKNFTKWFYEGKLHREGDKPAIIYKNGTQEWYIKGLLHRENDKPAIIRNNGFEEWYLNGARHRSFGKPAIKSSNFLDYFEFGEKLSKEKIKIKYKIGNF